MKKFSAILGVVLAAALTLSGCGGGGASSSSPTSSGAGAGNSGKKELVVATEAGFAPYEYYEGDKVVGVDIDIAQAIADSMGYTLKVVDMEFAAALASVNSGKADLAIAGISINEERKQQVDFSIEYATSKQILIVRADSAYTSIADLEGKAIGVQLGTVADLEITDGYPGISVRQYNKYLEAVMDLKNGKIDAIGMDVLPAEALVAANPELKILEQEFLIDKYAIAMKKGDSELMDSVNKCLNQLIADGKIAEFTLKHTTEK